ncbi:MAG: hypothetical protein ACK4N5_21310 [Myxococcales bacterium]
MTRVMMAAVAVAALVGSTGAVAQTKQVPGVEVLNLTGSDITGEVKGPGDVYVVVPPKPKFESQVKVRGSFTPELHRSTDNL